jgi:hypothetical protein
MKPAPRTRSGRSTISCYVNTHHRSTLVQLPLFTLRKARTTIQPRNENKMGGQPTQHKSPLQHNSVRFAVRGSLPSLQTGLPSAPSPAQPGGRAAAAGFLCPLCGTHTAPPRPQRSSPAPLMLTADHQLLSKFQPELELQLTIGIISSSHPSFSPSRYSAYSGQESWPASAHLRAYRYP